MNSPGLSVNPISDFPMLFKYSLRLSFTYSPASWKPSWFDVTVRVRSASLRLRHHGCLSQARWPVPARSFRDCLSTSQSSWAPCHSPRSRCCFMGHEDGTMSASLTALTPAAHPGLGKVFASLMSEWENKSSKEMFLYYFLFSEMPSQDKSLLPVPFTDSSK